MLHRYSRTAQPSLYWSATTRHMSLAAGLMPAKPRSIKFSPDEIDQHGKTFNSQGWILDSEKVSVTKQFHFHDFVEYLHKNMDLC